MLRYPNGRAFPYLCESRVAPVVGDEFDVFGRRWRVTSRVSPTRLGAAYPPADETFSCDWLSSTNSPDPDGPAAA